MLRIFVPAAILGLFSAVSGGAHAQTRTPEPSAERYTFQLTEKGVLRLDSRTGQVSQCSVGTAGPVCRASPDERTAFESEIARLEAENAALRKALADRGATALPPVPPAPIPEAADKSPPDSSSAAQNEPQPSKSRIRTVIDTAWRNLVALMSRMKGALQ